MLRARQSFWLESPEAEVDCLTSGGAGQGLPAPTEEETARGGGLPLLPERVAKVAALFASRTLRLLGLALCL